MGLDADIIAIGPFNKAIIDYLDYPEDYYADVPEGTIVITTFIFCNTTDSSHELAKAFGFDAWDFAKHKINPKNVNLKLLDEAGQKVGNEEKETIQEFMALQDAGFTFYYRPNG